MGYASLSGRARTSATNPRAHAICDRCGFRYNHVDLKWQYDWAGASLINKRILVCDTCYDKPQEQLRAIVVPADPMPIYNPRVQDFENSETNFLTANEPVVYDAQTGIPIPPTTIINTQDGQNITNLPYGRPDGLEQYAQAPLINAKSFNNVLSIVSINGFGTNTVQVTCSSPHGLTTNDQVSVEGINNPTASGIFSVNVSSATAFNYITYSAIPSGSLLTGTTRIATALVGIPYGYTQIPQVGP